MEKRAKSSELIKSKINCFDLLNEFNIETQRCPGDDSYRCKSFTHDGTNPTSCQVWQDSWYCHSSKKGGDVISMYAYLKYNGDNSKAFSDLLYRLNIGDDDYRKEEIDNYKTDMERLRLNVEQYHKNLKPEHIAYFKSRKIEEEFIDAYKCGYDPYSDRIIIPVWKDGQPIYWCARAFDSSKITKDYPKYKKPTIGFSSYRENELYGYDTLDRGNDDLWIAEGVFDFASLWQDGESVLCNATGMSNKHIQTVMQVAKDFKRLVLCFDNDSSGTKFTQRMFKSCFENNIQFIAVTIPDKWKGKPIKDISDAYCVDLLPETLIEKYSCDGVCKYLDQFDGYDELHEYLRPLAPYLNRAMKKKVAAYIDDKDKFDSDDKKELKKVLTRAKTQNEIARDFVRDREHPLWYSESLGLFDYTGTYWKQTNDYLIRKEFEDYHDTRNSEEKAIVDKIKVQAVDLKRPEPNMIECFNVNNGTIYFDKDNKEKPYYFVNKHDQKDYCTYCQPYDYNPKADNTVLMQFMHTLFKNHPRGEQNMIKRIQEHFGSVFFVDNIEGKNIMFVGEGSNGKSKLNDLVAAMLGPSLWCAISVQSLSKEFRLQTLIGKWANFFHDPKPDTYESEDLMKQMATNDSMTTNVKNKEPVTFKPRACVFIDANSPFHPKDKSEGWSRRFVDTTYKLYNTFTMDEDKVDNEHVFLADTQIMEKVCTNEGLSALLNFALEGYVSLVNNDKKYTPIPIDAEFNKELLSAGNHLFAFVCQFDFYSKNRDGEVTADELYLDYQEWYREQSYLEKFIYSKDRFCKSVGREFSRANRKVEFRRDSTKRYFVDLESKKENL